MAKLTQQTKPAARPTNTGKMPVNPMAKPQPGRQPGTGGAMMPPRGVPAGLPGNAIKVPPGTPPQVAALAQNPAFQAHVLGGGKPGMGGDPNPMAGGPGGAPDQGGYGPGGMNKPMVDPMAPGGGGGDPNPGGYGPAGGQPPHPVQGFQGTVNPFPPVAGDTTGQGPPQGLSNIFQDPGTLEMVRQNLAMARPGMNEKQMRPQGWVPGQAY